MLSKLLGEYRNFKVANVKLKMHVLKLKMHDLTFQFLNLLIAELAAHIKTEYCKFC